MGIVNSERMAITTKIIIVGLIVFVTKALAGEWQTTGGQYCIDKCQYHDDEYYFYWCHVSDPAQVYSDGTAASWWSNTGNNPGTKLKWDYCIPSELEADLGQESDQPSPPLNDHDGGLDWQQPGEDTNTNNNDGHDHGGHSENAIQLKGASTALWKFTPCAGQCSNRGSGIRSTCPVSNSNGHPLAFASNGQNVFYCVNERMPLREQLSSKHRLWCQDSCRKETLDHYFCTTLYGIDHCSPRQGTSSKGKSCAYPCELNESTLGDDYYFCYTRRDNSTWEYCGNWNVPQEKKIVMEFTTSDYVCADYCQKDDDAYEWCHYVWWDYNRTINTADLRKTWDYCRGHAPPPMAGWKLALIILGVGAGVALLTGLIYFFSR